jgi:hypothetical protein
MKTAHQSKNAINRRDFLKMASVGVAAAGVLPATQREAKADVKKLKFTFACSPYDRLQARIDGTVQVEGVELNFLPLEIEETFWRQLRYQEFDGSEISFSSYILARSRGDERFIALPWLLPEVERTRKIMGDDWWPYGIDKNRKTIEAMCQYSYEQGLSEKLMKIEDLFAPETFTEFKR